MKHLVLGSEGQIGKYVCDYIDSITKCSGDSETPEPYDCTEEIVRWDITLGPGYDLADEKNWPVLEMAMEEADFVHFLAFNVGGSKYLAAKQNSYEYIENNTAIMHNVFKALKVSKTPFYFASSQMQNMTDSAYGTLKNLGEFYTRALGGINVRFWNVYGYESDPEKTHVITDFIKMALTEKKILCRTNGEEFRHFTHARDAARMLHKITQADYKKIAKEEFIPVTAGRHVKIHEVAEMIAQLIGGVEIYFSPYKDKSQTKDNAIPSPSFVLDDYDLYVMNKDRIRLEDGLTEMIKLIAYDLQIEVKIREINIYV